MKRYNTEPNETTLPPESTCPHCGTKLDISSGITGNNPDARGPEQGDISLCINCGEPCQFGEGMVMVKLSDELLKDVLSDPVVVKAMRLIKHMDNPNPAAAYEAQLDKMLEDVRVWLKTGNWSPSIQYNFTRDNCVIASLDEALDRHVISVNDDALIMFEALGWLEDKPSMPTVLMVKVVMDNVFNKEKE
jgi:hypothetical protein